MKHLLSLVTLTACLAPAWADSPRAAVELRNVVEAASEQVVLGDVATIRCNDLQLMRQLVNLPLGSAPAGVQLPAVRRESLDRWIRARLALGPDQITWLGAESVDVQRATQVVTAQGLEQAARLALTQWLATKATRYAADATASLRDVRVARGELQIRPRPIEASAPSSRMTLWLDLFVDGVFARAVPVTFHVDAYAQGWVAAADLAPGTRLDAAVLSRRELKSTGGALPAADAPVGSVRAARALKSGEALTAANTAVAPAVARGDWVAVHLRAGDIEIEQRAQALQDGELGQLVRVRRDGADAEPISARVVGHQRVEIAL